ncbi:MAG: biopolymer transporter ExbD [Cellvibrionaceae bacterium]
MISLARDVQVISVSSPNGNENQSLELTPLIDIIFIVIVFLLLTANTRLLSLPVTVPETDEVASTTPVNQEIIAVTITEDNRGWFIDQQYFAEWSLFRENLLRQFNKKAEVTVSIAADQQADVQRFVKVLTLLQKQQIVNTHIILKEK